MLPRLFLAVLVFTSALNIFAATGDVDPAYNPKLTYRVNADSFGKMLPLPDGKWFLFGHYSFPNLGNAGVYAIRVNSDGTYDPTFDCPACRSLPSISAASVQTDGKLVLASSNKLIRVTAAGDLDFSFNTTFNTTDRTCGPVRVFSLPDGKTVVHCRTSENQSGTDSVERLDGSGAFDPTFSRILFSNAPREYIAQMVVQPDGKLFMGGFYFSSGGGWLRRYNADGTLDGSFSATVSGTVQGLGILPDGTYVTCGTFSSINGVSKTGYAKLFSNGGVDSGFTIPPGPNDWPRVIRTLADGRFYIWTFKNFAPNPSPARFVRYNSDGSVDNTFNQLTLNQTTNWELDAQGRIMTMPSSPRKYTRLNLDGTIDPSFDAEVTIPGIVNAAALQSDGKLVIVGLFDKANGLASATPFARLNADGSLDTTLNTGTGFNLTPDGVTVQPDGKIIAFGLFAGYNGSWRSNIARLNPDGSVDAFNPIVDGRVRTAAVLPDGKIIIGGDFQTINGITQKYLARLNADGSLDATFTPTFSNTASIFTIFVEPTGGFTVGGEWAFSTTVSGHTTRGVARFKPDGSLDTGFSANTNRVNAIARRPDGKYVAATRVVNSGDSATVFRFNSNGSPEFFGFSTQPADGVPSLMIQPTGNILYSAPSTRRYIERIGPNGEQDIFFPTFGTNNSVRAFIPLQDGKIIVVGLFSAIENVGRNGIAKISLSNRIRSTLFDFDNDGRADVSVFRPSTNTWYEILSGNGSIGTQTFGAPGDKIMPADYDADGKTDIGVFRPSTSEFIYIHSSTNTIVQTQWGTTGDIPFAADLDSNGSAEVIVYRPSTGTWWWMGSVGGGIVFGAAGDQPVIGDFDGDGKVDPAIFRPSTGHWWYAATSADYQQRASQWGLAGDIPVPGDYDGDSKTDHAVFRPSDGAWYIYNSSDGSYTALQFGTTGDIPAPADYDGDGRYDIAIFRPSTGIWYLWQSTSGFAGLQFGLNGDKPTASAFLP
jgi:uncharacterized delta-60 repeat protein